MERSDGWVDESTTCARLAPGWADAVLKASPWAPTDGPVLVVVPHPDDESLMFGGVLADCGLRGSPVHLLAVTDGGAAYPDVVDARTLAGLRRGEQDGALTELGLADATVTRLGIPDGCVADHEDVLVEWIVDIVADRHVSSVLAPWEHDHHTDHEACGRATVRARHRLSSEMNHPFTVVWGLFWSMLRDPAPPDVALASFALTSEHLVRKSAAIRRHGSQVDRLDALVGAEPVLGERELAFTGWRREHVIVEPPA